MRLETPAGVPQSQLETLYYNRYSIDFSQRLISWQGDCESIANWMRAFIFPPFQYPIVNVGGSPVEISSVRWDRLPHRGRPGEILAASNDAITVAAPGGRITMRLRHAGVDLDGSQFGQFGIAVGALLS